jgi:hypoxanthine phosphoribosyltransferase
MIIGITRGGWVPARNLCDFLGVKDLIGLKVEHWGVTATPDGEAKIRYPLKMDLTGKKVLVVDDITDTGKSLMVAVEHVNALNPSEIRTATLLCIRGSRFHPDYYAEEIDWKWIIFPWNVLEDLINLVSNYLREQGPSPPDDILSGLKDWYGIDVSEELLDEVLSEMEFREMIGVENGNVSLR